VAIISRKALHHKRNGGMRLNPQHIFTCKLKAEPYSPGASVPLCETLIVSNGFPPFLPYTRKALKISATITTSLYHQLTLKLYIMKTMNLLIGILFIGALAFTSCSKDNSLQPAGQDAELKAHETGEIWQFETDPLTNYPDPFTNSTTIEFEVREAGSVRLTVSGEGQNSIAVLFNGYKKPGIYQVVFDASDLEPGIYTAQLRAGGVVVKEQMQKIPESEQADKELLLDN
jgi:hypothetical protein